MLSCPPPRVALGLWPAAWTVMLVSLAPSAWAADTCASVSAEVGGGEPAGLAQLLENQSQTGGNGPRPLWQAATVLRCSLPSVADQAPRCLRAAQAKSMYDKFVQDSDGLRALKRERSDAQKSASQLGVDHGETCAALALQQAKSAQHDGAARLFEAVYVLTYRPLSLFNAARASELGAQWAEAEVYYTAYLALPIPWRDRRDAVSKLIEIQRRIAADAGNLVQRAQQTATDAKTFAQRADLQSAAALAQAKAAEGRAVTAEQRAQQGDARAQQAVQVAQTAETRALQAEQRAQSSEARAQSAEAAVQRGQEQLRAAVEQVRIAESRAQEAVQRAAQAQARVAELERLVRDLLRGNGQTP